MNNMRVMKFIIIMCSFACMGGCNTVSVDKLEDKLMDINVVVESGNKSYSNSVVPTERVDENNPIEQNNIYNTVTPEENSHVTIQPTQPVSDIKTYANNDKVKFNLESFKSIVLNVVNDDIWYKPHESCFKGFESNTMEMEIYIKNDDLSYIWVVFNYYLNDNIQHFITVLFNSDKRGFLNEISTWFPASTHQEVESNIGEDFTLYEKTEITFGKATKPVYPETTTKKDEIINEIIKKVTREMKIWNLAKGTYKIFVRNFRDNSGHTSTVIENTQGDKLIMDICINDDGSTEVDRVHELDLETLETWSELIKDNAVRVEDVIFDN